MGVHGQNSCEKNNKIYPFMYLTAIIVLIIIGSLYESDIIKRKNEYTKKSVWWYGGIGLVLTVVLVVVLNIIFKYIKVKDNIQTYIWYFSHILCYFSLTLASPGQWPFWLAIGITWELFECYLSCGAIKRWKVPITCSGMYDITANIAGIFIALWIHSEIHSNIYSETSIQI